MPPITRVSCVRGESFALSDVTGDILPGGDGGFYVRDVRFLDHLEIEVNGGASSALAGRTIGAGMAVFHGILRPTAPGQIDPTTRLRRTRLVDAGMTDILTVDNAGTATEPLVIEIRLGSDFADIFDARHGRRLERAKATTHPSSVLFERPGGQEATLVTLSVDGDVPVRPVVARVPGGAVAWVSLEVPAGGRRCVMVEVAARGNFGTVEAPPVDVAAVPPAHRQGADATGLHIHATDPRLEQVLERSAQDLAGLTMKDPASPSDRFAAAGSPWFLTLFGRDSLWAALMALPLDPDLAMGTLRTLARRQGARVDAETGEQPGKILHEVRHGALAERGDLPTTYYGTIDATPLFVILAHEVWRWGGHDAGLRDLLDPVEAALAWMRDHGDADGDGFLEYLPPAQRGLANQGWKDSADGIRFADGTIAKAPLALAEVQGYAYAAAMGGAELLDAFGRHGGEEWRTWAKRLAARFRDQFWVDDPNGPFPAVALDHDKVKVDAIASNMGHLLFTGMLTAAEARQVGDRLSDDAMTSGFGLRTLSRDSGGYNPLSYHCGSVWPHDTAIVAWGLARTGQRKRAMALFRQVLAAAPTFDHRLPELYSGIGTDEAVEPVPYPSACRPQAWAAGSAWLMLRAVLGIEPDVPHGVVRVCGTPPAELGQVAVENLAVGSSQLDVRVVADRIEVTLEGSGVTVDQR